MYCQAAHARIRIQALIAKLDKKGNIVAKNPESLNQGDAALIEV